MRRTIFILFLSLPFDALAQIPHWQWAEVGNDLGNSYGKDVTVDNHGNSYVTGTFENSITIQTLSASGQGGNDIFVAKFDPSGQALWVKAFGGKDDDNGMTLRLDSSQNLYLASSFSDTALFGSDLFISKGGSDLALMKLDSNGNALWSKAWGTIYDDDWGKMDIKNGTIYLTGSFGGYGGSPTAYETIAFDQFFLTSHGSYDVFVVKMDTSANVIWAKSGGGKFDDDGLSVRADGNGNVYITGDFDESNSVYFDNVHLTSKIGPFSDMFLVKYDSSGNVAWGRGAGGDKPTAGVGLAFDYTGNVTVLGVCALSNYVDFGGGVTLNNDFSFMVKYAPDGSLTWAKNIGWHNYDGVGDIVANGHDLFITGSFNGSAIFGNDSLIGYGGNDIYVNKYDSNGTHVWTVQAGGNSSENGYGLAFDQNGDLLVTGSTASLSANFGNHTINASQYFDMYIAKLSIMTSLLPSYFSSKICSIYPNPNMGSFLLDYGDKRYEKMSITDISGREVYHEQVNAATKQQINLNLSDGVYFIRLTGKDQSGVQKFIVQH